MLITGAAGGIGAALARGLCDVGAYVVLTDVDADALAALVARLGDRSSSVVLDVTDSGTCAEAVAATLAPYGRLDVVGQRRHLRLRPGRARTRC